MMVSVSAAACLVGTVAAAGAGAPFFFALEVGVEAGGVVDGGVVVVGVVGSCPYCWVAGLGCCGGVAVLGARYCITAIPTNTSRKASSSFFSFPGSFFGS